MRPLLLAILAWAGTSAAAFAQAAIAGSVKDSSGAALPGVTVEASSPALIEKTRTAVTDGHGRYRIEDLRPGVYTVRFTLKGWRPSQLEGVELTGSFTATADTTLAIGPLTDTVTVIGEGSAVDVYTAKHEVTLSGEIIRSIPTVRSYNALLALVPGVVTSSNDTVTGPASHVVPDSRRPAERGAAAPRRIECRKSGGREFGDQLRGGHRPRAGSDVSDGRCTG